MLRDNAFALANFYAQYANDCGVLRPLRATLTALGKFLPIRTLGDLSRPRTRFGTDSWLLHVDLSQPTFFASSSDRAATVWVACDHAVDGELFAVQTHGPRRASLCDYARCDDPTCFARAHEFIRSLHKTKEGLWPWDAYPPALSLIHI